MSARDRRDARQRRLAREERDVGGHLVVARARGVQPAADRPGELGEPPLDGHVDVLVVGREREAALAQLGLDRVQAGQQRVAVLVRDDPLRGQHARVRARLRDVVGPQAPVEADRRVEGLEGGILGLAEARHAGGAAYAALRPSAIWATWVARAKPSRYSVMAHPIQAPVPARWKRRSRSRQSSTHHGHEAEQAERHEDPRRPARDEVVGVEAELARDVGDHAVPEHDRAAPRRRRSPTAPTRRARRRRARSASARRLAMARLWTLADRLRQRRGHPLRPGPRSWPGRTAARPSARRRPRRRGTRPRDGRSARGRSS